MPEETKIINFGGVNCYLIHTGKGYILSDTGYPARRVYLQKELENSGCSPGNLKLIVLTHGDHDHSGNAAYLRDKFGTKIAMHNADSGMVERGDMNWNRKEKPDKFSIIFRIMSKASLFIKTGNFEPFKPDLYIDEGFNISEYGLDGKILYLPGHSKGSIGVLMAAGDLFCGDFLYNFFNKPGFVCCINDLRDYNASIEKLKEMKIKTLYPGHGRPFSIESMSKFSR